MQKNIICKMKIDRFSYKTGKELILDHIEDIDDEIDNSSFNNGYYKRSYDDIKKNIELLEKILKEDGFNLREFFERYETQIFKDFDFTGHSAFMDTLLYWYDKDKGELAGMKLTDCSEIEYVIKYQYGYFNYDMGRRYILQSYPTMEDYYNVTAHKLLIGILWPDYSSTLTDDEFNLDRGNAIKIAERCSIIKKHGEGYGIFVHLKSLYLELSKTTKSNIKYKEFIINLKQDLSNIPFKIYDDILEIMIGYDKSKYELDSEEINKELEIVYQANLYNL
jgi:hypothetical protein